MTIYIGNAFSANMINNATIDITNINKKMFLDAREHAYVDTQK